MVAHIRRPQPRRTRGEAGGEHRRYLAERFQADYRPRATGTFCGAPETTADWDRRTATSKAHADRARAECCADCLHIATTS